MPINSNKGLKSAVAAPFAKRYQLALDRSEIDYAWDSDFNQTISDPTGTFETETIGGGLDPLGNGLLKIGGEAINPRKKVVTFNLAANGSLGTGGSAGAQTFYIADMTYVIWGITEIHKTAGNDAGAVTGYVSHETGTQAPGGGVTVMSQTFNLKGTANTLQTATLVETPSAGLTANSATTLGNHPIVLQKGDRLSFVFTGTLTTLAGVVVSVTLTPGNNNLQAVYYVNSNADLSNQTFYIANRDGMKVQRIDFCWATNFATNVTLQVTKDTGTTAPGQGTSLFSGGTAIKIDGSASSANTVVTPALTATAATLQLAAGDRIGVAYSATTTGTGMCICVTFAPIYAGRTDAVWQLGANAQQQVAQCFFLADRSYEVEDVSEVHGTAAGGAATIAITIDKGTTAPGGGTKFQNNAGSLTFNLNATANTVQVGDSTNSTGPITLTSLRNRSLQAGDRLGVNIASGASQSLANVCVTVSLKAA